MVHKGTLFLDELPQFRRPCRISNLRFSSYRQLNGLVESGVASAQARHLPTRQSG